MMDYIGLFSDLVDMWSRAISAANSSDDSILTRHCRNFAGECLQFERDIYAQMRQQAEEAA